MNMQISLRLHSTTPSLSAPLSLAYMDSSSKNIIKNIKVAGTVCITCIQISNASSFVFPFIVQMESWICKLVSASTQPHRVYLLHFHSLTWTVHPKI